MDISYLLLLQNFREVTNNIFTPFFEFMSELVVTAPFYIAIAVIYWSISKRTGTMLLFNFAVGGLLNQLVKNTCCVYRPWIRDARVLPAGDSLTTATGYSFPSGHTQRATAIFETTAIWQKKRRWLAALLILALITVGFARNYLGVHTPQDVFVGFFLCSLVIFANSKILPWAEKKQGRDLILLAAGAVITALFLAFITFKSYPLDYVGDKLLVDPNKMMNDCYGEAGAFLAVLISWVLERRFIKFSADGTWQRRTVRAVIGIIPLCLLLTYAPAPLYAALGNHWGRFTMWLIFYSYLTAIYPLCIMLVQKRAFCKQSI